MAYSHLLVYIYFVFLSIISNFVRLFSPFNTSGRDAKDNYLLALAKDSQADFLITGDQDLLILQQFGITKIVTYQQFLVICRLGFVPQPNLII
jgi:predicted nucleic acid-binding protein